jgi:Integrase core domain
MDNTIASCLTKCIPCIKLEKYKTYPKGELYPMEKGHQPFQIWAIDLIPSLPLDSDGNSVLAVAVDCLLKWVKVRKLPQKTPELLADWLEVDILSRYGIPKIIRTDNGTEFEGEFAQLLHIYGIVRRTTSPSHPQTNGQAERII